jgi:hypothetical protein
MDKLKSVGSQSNVNVTLAPSDPALEDLRDKEFPCPLCGAGLPILATKRKKPYFTCNFCGIQIFVRGKAGISRLHKMANAGILICGTQDSVSHGINLLNRLEQLKLQRQELKRKLGLIFTDANVENVICMVDAEIEKVEGELAKLAAKKENQIK